MLKRRACVVCPALALLIAMSASSSANDGTGKITPPPSQKSIERSSVGKGIGDPADFPNEIFVPPVRGLHPRMEKSSERRVGGGSLSDPEARPGGCPEGPPCPSNTGSSPW